MGSEERESNKGRIEKETGMERESDREKKKV